MDGWKTYLLMISTDKIRISPDLSFYIDDIDVYFSFLFFTFGNLQFLNHYFIPHTYIPDKFIEFDEFNTMLKRENSIVAEKPFKLPAKFAC